VKTLVNQDFSALPDISFSLGDYFIPEITFEKSPITTSTRKPFFHDYN